MIELAVSACQKDNRYAVGNRDSSRIGSRTSSLLRLIEDGHAALRLQDPG